MESVADELAEKLADKSKALKCGDPFDPETDIGTLIDEEAAIRVERAVDAAVKDGARVLCGHEREGALYPPTVIDRVDPQSDMVVNECFGPTCPIIRCRDLEEAVEIANSTEYGLQSGILTKDLDNIRYAINKLKVGAVNINEGPQFDMPNIPFGGVKQSGIGREGVKYAMQEMTYVKTVSDVAPPAAAQRAPRDDCVQPVNRIVTGHPSHERQAKNSDCDDGWLRPRLPAGERHAEYQADDRKRLLQDGQGRHAERDQRQQHRDLLWGTTCPARNYRKFVL